MEQTSHRMALMIPYRDRVEHLQIFLEVFPSAIQIAKIPVDYEIFVIEQANDKLFNRGKLLNAGFDVLKDSFDYFCFHDVDMLPIKVDYSYTNRPTHLALNVSQFNTWRTRTPLGLPYETYLGGVCLFNKDDFIKLNGFSNGYWGWGAEDDDMFFRISKSDLGLIRRNGLFESIHHQAHRLNSEVYKTNLDRLKRISLGEEVDLSGLFDLTYKVVAEKHFKNPNYTMYSIDI